MALCFFSGFTGMAFSRAPTRTSTSSSPGSQRPKFYYVHELPYCDLYELARHLNADKKWPILGASAILRLSISHNVAHYSNISVRYSWPHEIR